MSFAETAAGDHTDTARQRLMISPGGTETDKLSFHFGESVVNMI